MRVNALLSVVFLLCLHQVYRRQLPRPTYGRPLGIGLSRTCARVRVAPFDGFVHGGRWGSVRGRGVAREVCPAMEQAGPFRGEREEGREGGARAACRRVRVSPWSGLRGGGMMVMTGRSHTVVMPCSPDCLLARALLYYVPCCCRGAAVALGHQNGSSGAGAAGSERRAGGEGERAHFALRLGGGPQGRARALGKRPPAPALPAPHGCTVLARIHCLLRHRRRFFFSISISIAVVVV